MPIGVEFHAGGVRLLQLARGRSGVSVVGAAKVSVDDRGRSPEDKSFIDELVDGARRGLSLGRFRGRRIVIGLDGRMVRTRSIRQPRLSTAEQDKAARLDAPARLGFSENEACEIGWLRAGEVRQNDEAKDELLYLGARRDPLEHMLARLADKGFTPVAVEPNFTAIARCFTRTLRRASDENTARVIVSVGEASSEIMVTRGRLLAFYKQVEVGGRTMTAMACERLGLDIDTVRDLRRRRMAAVSDDSIDAKVDRALFDAVRPMINDLAQEVTLCLRYYSVTFRGVRPDLVVVAGSEAAEPNLARLLGEAINVPAQVGQPLEGVETSRASRVLAGPDCTQAEWGACHGLSTRALELLASKKDRPWKARAAA